MAEIMRISNVWVGLLVLLTCLPFQVRAQPDQILSELNYFEGAIYYKFKVSGEASSELRSVNAIEFMELHIKDNNYLIHLYGSPPQPPAPFDPMNPKVELPKQVLPTTHLFLADSNHTYIIDASNERYFVDNAYTLKRQKEVPEAVRTGDSMLVAKVLCYAYRVSKPDEEITYFISPKIRVNLARFKDLDGAKANFLTKGLNGCIPLRTVRKTPTYTVVIECTKVVPKKYDRSLFQLPAQFERIRMDYRR